MKVVPLIESDCRLSIVPFGWVSCADTISSETSDSIIAEFNSTVQVTVTEDLTYTGLDGVLVTDTEAVEGTEGRREEHHSGIVSHNIPNLLVLCLQYDYASSHQQRPGRCTGQHQTD